MADQLRVGVIGTGFGRRVHLPGFREHPDTTVSGVWGSTPEKAHAVADEYEVPRVFERWEDLISSPEIDLVSIATPPFLHCEQVLRALEAGKHVLCEKPLALNVAQGRLMRDAARASGTVAAINHEFRFLPARAYLARLSHEGELGRVRSVDVVSLYSRHGSGTRDRWSWWSDADSGGGMLGAIGVHYADSIRTWFGEVSGVCACLSTFVPELPDPTTGEPRRVTSDDSAVLIMRLESSAVAAIHLNGAVRGSASRVVAAGDRCMVMIENDETVYEVGPNGELEQMAIPADLQVVPVGGERLIAPFVRLVTELVKAVRGEESAVPTLEDGLRGQEVLDAARKSNEERRWVGIAEVRI